MKPGETVKGDPANKMKPGETVKGDPANKMKPGDPGATGKAGSEVKTAKH
jgi:hypothetical protein